MKRKIIPYSQAELDFLKAHRTMPRRELHAAFVGKFNRQDVSLDNLKALCKRKGWLTGRSGRFEGGHVPDNKGKSMPYNANSAKTQFKKGQLPHNTKFAGHERLGQDGYVWISVNETNPHTGYCRRYVQKHRWLWEQANGPVPEGMVLKCLDGNRQNTDPANWKLISRAMLVRLSGGFGRGYDNAPDVLKPTIMAVTELEHQAKSSKRKTVPIASDQKKGAATND